MKSPALAHLASAYFHLDWADEFHDDPLAAVDAFVRGTPDLAPLLPDEITDVLDRISSEQEIETFQDSLGSCLRVVPQEETYRGWLTEIARRVSADGRTSG